MIRKCSNEKMGRSNLGWLRSVFHFSFAEYFNPANMNFGNLRVVNDDLVEPGKGFELHPHQDMEIISYVVSGELTHGDNMGNQRTVTRGSMQYMSAGTGVWHSEHNYGNDTLRFLQIWILPNQRGLKPNYGDYFFDWKARENKWLHMVSSRQGKAPIQIYQDVNMYTLALDKDYTETFLVASNRQVYLVQIEGESDINGISLSMRDALEAVEEPLTIQAKEDSHFILLEMEKK